MKFIYSTTASATHDKTHEVLVRDVPISVTVEIDDQMSESTKVLKVRKAIYTTFFKYLVTHTTLNITMSEATHIDVQITEIHERAEESTPALA